MQTRFGLTRLMWALLGAIVLIPADMTTQKLSAPASVPVDAVDLALDFVPGVCVVKDIVSLGLGVNLITGDPLSLTDGIALICWLLLPAALRRTRHTLRWRLAEMLRWPVLRLALPHLHSFRWLARKGALTLLD